MNTSRAGASILTRTGPVEEDAGQRLPDGVHSHADGSCRVSGAALGWVTALDEAIVGLAARWAAVEYRFPPLIAAADLERIDYFRSFPHLVTLPATVSADPAARERFVDRAGSPTGTVPLVEHEPIRHALTPAACYPVYPTLRDRQLDGATYVTVASTCFRREAAFVPLRRQWAFTMREIVCLGTAPEVDDFLVEGRGLVETLCRRMDLDMQWEVADDPFFDPDRNGRALVQRLWPTKHEAVVDALAIGSINRHHDHFGHAFGISRGTDTASSGCVALGLDRWLGVVAGRWGTDPAVWPDPRRPGDDDD